MLSTFTASVCAASVSQLLRRFRLAGPHKENIRAQVEKRRLKEGFPRPWRVTVRLLHRDSPSLPRARTLPRVQLCTSALRSPGLGEAATQTARPWASIVERWLLAAF